jgi:hypothetical protein
MKPPIIIKEHIKPLALTTPIMTREKFSEATGLSDGSVRGMMERQQIPTIKIGKRILVNLAALTWTDTPTLLVPVVTKETLADNSGLTERCISEQYYLGNMPGISAGKKIMIDMVQLTNKCMTAAQQ